MRVSCATPYTLAAAILILSLCDVFVSPVSCHGQAAGQRRIPPCLAFFCSRAEVFLCRAEHSSPGSPQLMPNSRRIVMETGTILRLVRRDCRPNCLRPPIPPWEREGTSHWYLWRNLWTTRRRANCLSSPQPIDHPKLKCPGPRPCDGARRLGRGT